MSKQVKFYINNDDFIIVNLTDFEVLDEDDDCNEWGEPIYYDFDTDRSMTFDYVEENSI